MSSSLLLFPRRFGRYLLRPSSGVCRLNFWDEAWWFYIIKGFRTIVFIFIVISTAFRPICSPAFFRCLLSKFLKRSLMIFIIKGFRTIVFIFIVISTTFRPIYLVSSSVCRKKKSEYKHRKKKSYIIVVILVN